MSGNSRLHRCFAAYCCTSLPQALLTAALLPWRNVLQSCALMCAQSRIAELTHALIAAGVTRIAPIGSIHDGYAGEPHDGVYALQRLSRRVSVSLAATQLPNQASLDLPLLAAKSCAAIMNKEAFVAQPINDQAQLYFRSGGSSGTCSGRLQLSRFRSADARNR